MQLEIIQSITCGMHELELMMILIKLHHNTYMEKKNGGSIMILKQEISEYLTKTLLLKLTSFPIQSH